ncbi:MAG: AsmA-like C-terminal domain-containing protein [Desulfobacter sp.]|nr:AsmA-like C-terminal domain-containing protein [Desulfobacter sp.]
MTPEKKNIKRIAVYTTGLILVLLIAAPLVIEPFLNSPPVKARSIWEIKKISQIDVLPDDIEFFIAPLPGLRFLNLDIPLNQEMSLAIKQLEVKIDLSQLLKRKIAVSQILMDNPDLKYSPKTPSPSKPSGPSHLFHTPLQMPDQTIERLFTLFPDSQDDLEIIVNQAQTDYFALMDARFQVFKDNRSLKFNARIKEVDLKKDQISSFDLSMNDQVQRIRVQDIFLTLSLDRDNTLSGKIRLNRPQITLSGQGPALAAEDLNIGFSLSKDHMTAALEPAVITYPKARVSIDFSDNKNDKKTAVTFKGKDIDIGQAREVYLDLLKGNQVIDILFDILRGGTAKEIVVGFKAQSLLKLFDGNNLELDGNAESAIVKIPEVPLIVDTVFGRARVDKGILHIENPTGKIGSTRLDSGTLDIDLRQDDIVPFKGRFQLNTGLDELPQTLISLLPGTQLAKELEQVSQVQGRADAVLELEMPENNTPLKVRVWAKNINARARYRRVPLPIRIDTGQFHYEPESIVISNIKGQLGTSPIKDLFAKITNLEQAPVLTIKNANARLNIAQFMPWIKKQPSIMDLVSPAQALNGTLIVDQMTMEGPMFSPDQWQFDIQGSGSEICVKFQNKDFSIENLSGQFQTDQDNLNVSLGTAKITDISWLDMRIDPKALSSVALPLQLIKGSIKKNRGKDFFHAGVSSPGGPEIYIDFTGESLSDLVPSLVRMKDKETSNATIIVNPDPKQPIFTFDGTLNTKSLEKCLVPGSFLFQKLLSLTGKNPFNLSMDSEKNLYATARQINLDALMGEGRKTDSKKKKNTTKNRALISHKNMRVKADALIYKEKTFHGVNADISFDPEKTKVQIRHAQLCSLITKGYVDIFHNTSEIASDFEIISNEKEDISLMLGCLFGTQSVIEGSYRFNGKLSGKADAHLITARQNGTIDFKAESGRIFKATILSRVLSVLNVLGDTYLQQLGFGYKTLTLKAEVKDSIIHIKKAYIDADNMAIIASGWIDPLKDKLDLTILVAPFKTIDTIIQHIPVVNTILSGRLVSFPAKASGKISDPKVIPLHPSAVGKGLVNLFGDLIKAPVRLIEGTKKNDQK